MAIFQKTSSADRKARKSSRKSPREKNASIEEFWDLINNKQLTFKIGDVQEFFKCSREYSYTLLKQIEQQKKIVFVRNLKGEFFIK